MPMLAPRNTSLPFTENAFDIVSRIRSATCTASSGAPTSPRTSVNRSPPLRESVSDSRRQPASRSAPNWIKVPPGRCPSDAFEAVQIQIEQRGHPALPAGARHGLAKPVFEEGSIGTAREQVVRGLARSEEHTSEI